MWKIDKIQKLLNLHWVYWTLFFVIFFASLGVSLNYLEPRIHADSAYYPNVPFGEQLFETISENLPDSDKNTILNSRGATVKIYTTLFLDYPPFVVSATGTGIYVTFEDRNYILTAAHMVADCNYLYITTGHSESADCWEIAYVDEELDIALIEIEGPLSTRTAISLMGSINASKDYSIGEEIYYSGYPNDSGLLTIKGRIAGYSYDKFLLQSYAWHGASGSGIFNSSGELIGVVSAVQVGYDSQSFELIETIVYGAPISLIDFSLL